MCSTGKEATIKELVPVPAVETACYESIKKNLYAEWLTICVCFLGGSE